jgi:hypothetical protein
MGKKIILGALLLVLPAAAQAMDIATFLRKADALEKKGMTAMFSSDFKLLKKEVETSSLALRAERLAAPKAGRRPAYCPPPKSGLNSDEILAYFRTIPVARRPQMQVKEGLLGLLARKFPCRG